MDMPKEYSLFCVFFWNSLARYYSGCPFVNDIINHYLHFFFFFLRHLFAMQTSVKLDILTLNVGGGYSIRWKEGVIFHSWKILKQISGKRSGKVRYFSPMVLTTAKASDLYSIYKFQKRLHQDRDNLERLLGLIYDLLRENLLACLS